MGGYILADSGKREAALEFYRRALGFKVGLPVRRPSRPVPRRHA
jgi:hypothetical protein